MKVARPRRPVDGVLLIDKPVGSTSNGVLQHVKRLYQAQKAGHTGSLDPLASGVLPICLGEATKLSGYLLNADKAYTFTCQLGVTTTTGDAEGEILATRPVEITPAQVVSALTQFIGTIAQVPPMYSAIKHQGQPLYRLARRGIEIDRAARTITIHTLTLLRFTGDTIECALRCSKGTYVRTLAADLGEVLGCGAHVTALRRTAVAPYDTERMITLDALSDLAEQGLPALDAALLPVDSAIATWPAIHVRGQSAFYLRQGHPIVVPHAPTEGWVRLYEGDQTFLGIGIVLEDGRIAPRRLLATIPT